MSEHAPTQTQAKSQPTFTRTAKGMLQRQCACSYHAPGDERDECRKKYEGLLQRPATSLSSAGEVPPIVYEVLRSPGRPLDEETRAFMEPRFGCDFSGVRVHTDSKAAESARTLNASAYTVGPDIVFGTRQYVPGALAERYLLAHELAHALQQMQRTVRDGVLPNPLTMNSPTDGAEEVADQIARRVTTGEPISPPSPLAVSGILARLPVGGNPSPAQTQPARAPTRAAGSAPHAVTLRGTNPAVCMAPLCGQIARVPLPHSDDELRQRADEWRNGALACVRGGAAASNASHHGEILANAEQELQAGRDTFVQDFEALPQAQRNRLRRDAIGWLQERCHRSRRETQIEFHYNVVFENPSGGLQWGVNPAEWDEVEGALAALPAEATWMNARLLRFRRAACHPGDVDPSSGLCTGQGAGLVRSFTGGETNLQTGEITIFTPGLGQAPFARSMSLGLSATFHTLRHEIGHVAIDQTPQAARDDFFERIMEWHTYPWHWINVRQPLPGTAQELRQARSRLCAELAFTGTSGGCDDARLDRWLSGIQLDQEVQLGGRTYVRRTRSQGYLQSIRTASLAQGAEFEYARTDQTEYLTELYTLAVSRPEFLHSALPAAQIAWLKTHVFHTPVHLATLAVGAPDAVHTEFLIRGSRLFTWEQLDALLSQLLAEHRAGGRSA